MERERWSDEAVTWWRRLPRLRRMHARWGSTQIEMLRDASGEHTLASGPSLEQLAEPPPMRGETRGPHHRRWAVPI